MKKIVFVFLLIFTMLFVSCTEKTAGKKQSASHANSVVREQSSSQIVVSSYYEDKGVEEGKQPEHKGVRLTLNQVERINEYYRNNPQWQYVLKGRFDSPEKIDVTDIVNSLSAESMLTYNCYYEVKMRKEAGISLDYDRLEKGLEEHGRIS